MRCLGLMMVLAAATIGLAGPARAAVNIEECAGLPAGDQAPAWSAELPSARPTTVTKLDVTVQAPDGAPIQARVYLPDAFAGPKPTVLHMSPYWGSTPPQLYRFEAEDLGIWETPLGELSGYSGSGTVNDCAVPFFLRRGYAVVLAASPGTYESGGCGPDYGGRRDGEAGAALVEWIARQEWSDATVGMRGHSAEAMVQYATAVQAPAALKAIIPSAPPLPYVLMHAGAVQREFAAGWVALQAMVAAPPPLDPTSDGFVDNLANTACEDNNSHFVNPDGTMDAYWRERHHPLAADRITAGVLHITGAGYTGDNAESFGQIWEALEEAGVPRKGVLGPWPHNYPEYHVADWFLHELRWFEHWLRGVDTGVTAEPRLTLHDQHGAARFADTFSSARRLWASAGSLGGSPTGGTATYTDIPGLQRTQVREDASTHVAYTTEPLRGPLRISGIPRAQVVAAIAGADDTNLAVLLSDVAADGTSRVISVGYRDAQHPGDLSQAPRPLIEGEVVRYPVDLGAVEYTVAAGHRLEMLIASSDGCLPELLTGGMGLAPATCFNGMVTDGSAATVTIHEGPNRTLLDLPVVR